MRVVITYSYRRIHNLIPILFYLSHVANQQKGDTEIAEILEVGRNTVWRTKKRYREEGLQSALTEKPRPGQPKKYTERHEAEIIAQHAPNRPMAEKDGR
ncbi:helix-turn-helix domain-containing protein [Methanophagales archaeon]|nr:MAG: helix-turn-helix domain-containing protein [Methanophagales archaeon]